MAVPQHLRCDGQHNNRLSEKLIGRDGLVGFHGFARQRIIDAFVQLANAVAIEALFLDFQIGAEQQFRRQFLNGKRIASAAVGNRLYPIGRRDLRLRLGKFQAPGN